MVVVAASMNCSQCGMVVTISAPAREVKIVCPCGTRFEQSDAAPAADVPHAPPLTPASFSRRAYLVRLAEVAALLCGDRLARCAREYPFGLTIRGIDDEGAPRFVSVPDTTIFDYSWLIERLAQHALRAGEWEGSPAAFAKHVMQQYVVRTHDEVQLLLRDDWRSFPMHPSDHRAIAVAFMRFFTEIFPPEASS